MLKYVLDVPCITIQIKNKEDKMNSKIKQIARLSIVCAMYVVLTIVNPFSYDTVQFRISEILMFLVFFQERLCYKFNTRLLNS